MTKDNMNFHELIDGMRRELDSSRRMTLESFIMPEQSSMGAESGSDSPVPSKPALPTKPQITKSPATSSHLAQIRRIAIEGIRDLADNPTDPAYEMLKKIWNMCDKAIDSSNQHLDSEE